MIQSVWKNLTGLQKAAEHLWCDFKWKTHPQTPRSTHLLHFVYSRQTQVLCVFKFKNTVVNGCLVFLNCYLATGINIGCWCSQWYSRWWRKRVAIKTSGISVRASMSLVSTTFGKKFQFFTFSLVLKMHSKRWKEFYSLNTDPL